MPNAATQSEQISDPIDRVRNMSERLTEVIDCLRADIGRIEAPQFKAMFETAAEVLGGLVSAFRHYQEEKRTRLETAMIRKLKLGGYRLYSRKINPKAGRRRNLTRRGGEARARGAIF